MVKNSFFPSEGISSFLADTKQYYGISSRLWGGESLTNFTRRELELYKQVSDVVIWIRHVIKTKQKKQKH